MQLNQNKVSINFESYFKTNAPNTLVLLHGFTGSAEDWKPFTEKINNKFNVVAIDLIGHGKSSSPSEESLYLEENISEQIYKVIDFLKLKNIVLLGYSMGGRAALSFTLKYTKIVSGLILESTTAGIENELMKNERARNDERLAKYILDNPLERFIDYWMNLDLFSSQKNLPEKKKQLIKESKLKNNKIGLANTLRGFSTGKMLPLFDQLKNLKMKTLLISGEYDKKFTEINFYMEKLLSNSQHVIIKNAGHNTHLEQPEIFVSVLNDFLNQF